MERDKMTDKQRETITRLNGVYRCREAITQPDGTVAMEYLATDNANRTSWYPATIQADGSYRIGHPR
jgi:hypothetical protein